MKLIHAIVILSFIVISSNLLGAYEYRNCDGGASTLKSATIKGCEGAHGAACHLKVGQLFNVNATFVAHQPFKTAYLYFEYKTVDGQYKRAAEGGACLLGVECPSRADQLQSLGIFLVFPMRFANVTTDFRLRIIAEKRNKFCIQFPVAIGDRG